MRLILRQACRWQRAPLPIDEDRRLQALRDLRLLDTPAEDRFDRLTRLASAVGVPMALVSLVDRDRQWFKSRMACRRAGHIATYRLARTRGGKRSNAGGTQILCSTLASPKIRS